MIKGVGEEFPFFDLNGVDGDKEIITLLEMILMGGRLFISTKRFHIHLSYRDCWF